MKDQSYLSTPAKSDSCPFSDCTLCLLLDILDDRGNLLLSLPEVRMASEVRANGLLLLFRVSWKPGRTCILALQEVRNEDLVLVGAFATIGKKIGALN